MDFWRRFFVCFNGLAVIFGMDDFVRAISPAAATPPAKRPMFTK
jgi:hypothetical protein